MFHYAYERECANYLCNPENLFCLAFPSFLSHGFVYVRSWDTPEFILSCHHFSLSLCLVICLYLCYIYLKYACTCACVEYKWEEVSGGTQRWRDVRVSGAGVEGARVPGVTLGRRESESSATLLQLCS